MTKQNNTPEYWIIPHEFADKMMAWMNDQPRKLINELASFYEKVLIPLPPELAQQYNDMKLATGKVKKEAEVPQNVVPLNPEPVDPDKDDFQG